MIVRMNIRSLLYAIIFSPALAAPSLYDCGLVLKNRLSLTKIIRSTNPQIQCPQDYNGITQAEFLQRAIDVARYIAADAHAEAGKTPSAAYSAIFKTLEHEKQIVSRYSLAATLPALSTGPLKFYCINSEAQAATIGSGIWHRCETERRRSILIARTSSGPDPIIAVCPSFWNLADEDFDPMPARCPRVQDNIFAQSSVSWRTKACGILAQTFVLYNTDIHWHSWGDFNDCLKFTGAQAAYHGEAFMAFVICMFSPDLHSSNKKYPLS